MTLGEGKLGRIVFLLHSGERKRQEGREKKTTTEGEKREKKGRGLASKKEQVQKWLSKSEPPGESGGDHRGTFQNLHLSA